MELPTFYMPSELLLALVWSNIKRVYSFCDFFVILSLFLLEHQKHTFSFRPLTSDFADKMTINNKNVFYSWKKKSSLLCLYLLRPTCSKHHPQLFVYVFFDYPNHEQDSLCTFMKSTKNIIKIRHSSIHKSIRSGLWRTF